MWRVISLAVAASIALAVSSQAETLVDHATKAANLIAAGKTAEALEEATRVRDLAWDAAPIAFTTATFVDGKPAGYGQYTPRASTVFKPGDAITIYAEPVGYGYGRDGAQYLIDLDADIELQTPQGQILVREESFTRLSGKGLRPIREFQVSFSIALDGLTAGDYVLVTRLKDAHGDKTGSFSLPFSIPQPEPAPKPEQQ